MDFFGMVSQMPDFKGVGYIPFTICYTCIQLRWVLNTARSSEDEDTYLCPVTGRDASASEAPTRYLVYFS